MTVIFWIMFFATLEGHQFEFDGSLEECKKIAKNRMKNNSKIQAGCYEIKIYPPYLKQKFEIIIK